MAKHDFEVRALRMQKARDGLVVLRREAERKKLSTKTIIQRATRVLVEAKASQYFAYVADKGYFIFWPRHDIYRQQRRHDGLFVLRTNHPELRGKAILDTYLQLQEVERCFRVIKSVVKLRPMYHYRDRRVEAHIFLNFLAFLLAKVLQLKLQAAQIDGSIPWALDHLKSWDAVEHTWEGESIVVQTSKPSKEAQAIIDALGLPSSNPVIRVTPAQTTVA